MGANINNEVKEEFPFAEKVLSKKDIIGTVAGVVAASYPVVNTIYSILYQSECEKFYFLPGKYFYSSVDNKLLYLGCALILMLFCIVPTFIKRYDLKQEDTTKGSIIYVSFLAAIIGMGWGLVNVFNLAEIMKQTNKTNTFFRYINNLLNKNANITIGAILFLGLFTILGFTHLDILQNIKLRIVRKILNVVFTISFVLSLILMIYGMICKFSISIEDKTKYEFVTFEDKEYVVLSERNDKILVTPYDVNEKGQYIFKTDQYLFLDSYKGIYNYVDIKYSPLISSEENKE